MTMTGYDRGCQDDVKQISQRLNELRRWFDDDIRHAPRVDATKKEEFLLVRLSSETYAFPVTYALEIVSVPTIVPVPGVPPSILGVINFRGQTLSVATIHRLLGLPDGDQEADRRIIVTKGLPLVTGIMVDAVEGIAEVAAAEIQPVPATMSADKAHLLAGQIYVNDRLISLLDVEPLCACDSLRVEQASSTNETR